MARTELINSYINNIDALNDQLWYFLFVSEELNQDLARYSAKAKKHYTVDLFASNPFSKRIHVKADSLIDHQNRNKKFTFGSYFSTCYEIGANYIKDIFEKLKTFNALPNYLWNHQSSPEQNLSLLLANNGINIPTPIARIFDTITYLRLRRNHFTHLINVASTRFIGFCAISGVGLNAYWVSPGTIRNIDFTSTIDINNYAQDTSIELIKALRISLITLDTYIASILNVNSVIKFLVKRQYESKKVNMNALIAQKRNAKIVNIAKIELDVIITAAQCDPFVRNIGIK